MASFRECDSNTTESLIGCLNNSGEASGAFESGTMKSSGTARVGRNAGRTLRSAIRKMFISVCFIFSRVSVFLFQTRPAWSV